MEINKINFPSPIQIFRIIPLPSVSQQKIMAVATLIILGGVALCYTIYLIGRKYNFNENNGESINISSINYLRNITLSPSSSNIENTTNLFENRYIQPTVLPPEDHNEKSFKKNLSLYANTLFKNTISLEEARVILIGERHDITEHCKLEGIILKYFAKENDVLLVEGILKEEKELLDPAALFPHELEKSIPKRIHAFGWEKDLETLRSQIKMMSETELYIQRFNNASNDAEKLIVKQEMRDIENKICLAIKKRNDFLVSSIKESMEKYPNSKVFVIAGSGHVLHKKEYDYSLFSPKDSIPTSLYIDIFDFNILENLPPEVRAASVILKNPLISI
ncbi:MAG: hypothetical protein H0V82_06235 [Candidatus Protochlamydia sp.]|nr:hypothetical protein [Candidatus Protochlamydia sp.]